MLSCAAHTRLCSLLPGGVNSPARAFVGLGVNPLIAASAKGPFLFNEEGEQWTDFCMSWGALILGHSPPEVIEAVQQQVRKGTSFGVSSFLEEQLARRVMRHFPSIELIRFVCSGTEATMSAVRLARGFTGRSAVVKFNGNYHGHSDGFLVQAGSGLVRLGPRSASKGVPEAAVGSTYSLPYNDIEAVLELFAQKGEEIAAVIVEPVAGNMGVVPADPLFLETLRRETERVGALLIFDEVITGFRVARGGAQALYGIQPHLTCLGKIIGGGFPVAAFGGQREVMELLAPLGEVYQAGTLAGNAIAMAAADATLEALEAEGFYETLQSRTDQLCQPIEALIQERDLNACLQRVGSMWTLFFGQRQVRNLEDAKATDFHRFRAVFQRLYEAGIFLPPSPYESAFVGRAHTEELIQQTVDHLIRALVDP